MWLKFMTLNKRRFDQQKAVASLSLFATKTGVSAFQAAPVSLINAFGVLLIALITRGFARRGPISGQRPSRKMRWRWKKIAAYSLSRDANGGKLNLRGKIMKRLLTAMLVLFFCTRHIESAHATDVEFIFSGQDVRAVGYTGGKCTSWRKNQRCRNQTTLFRLRCDIEQ